MNNCHREVYPFLLVISLALIGLKIGIKFAIYGVSTWLVGVILPKIKGATVQIAFQIFAYLIDTQLSWIKPSKLEGRRSLKSCRGWPLSINWKDSLFSIRIFEKPFVSGWTLTGTITMDIKVDSFQIGWLLKERDVMVNCGFIPDEKCGVDEPLRQTVVPTSNVRLIYSFNRMADFLIFKGLTRYLVAESRLISDTTKLTSFTTIGSVVGIGL
uniref:Uncharacterized protein n=1 Tax=Tetranychus urticae TaxID=32264 RepID=A0A158P539_TETUR